MSLTAVADTPDGLVPLRGEVDRIDRIPERFGGGIHIVDYKNGKLAEVRFRDRDMGKFHDQIGIYALMYEAETGVRPRSGLLLVSTSEQEAIQVVIDEPLLYDVRAKLGRAWRDLHDRLLTFGYEPSVSDVCG